MTFLLTLGDTQQRARSLTYAKALAPQMFQRAGTQHLFNTIRITAELTGIEVATYGRLGWRDEGSNDSVASAAFSLDVEDCPGCDGYRVVGTEYCTPRCAEEDQQRKEAEGQFAHLQHDTWAERRGEA